MEAASLEELNRGVRETRPAGWTEAVRFRVIRFDSGTAAPPPKAERGWLEVQSWNPPQVKILDWRRFGWFWLGVTVLYALLGVLVGSLNRR